MKRSIVLPFLIPSLLLGSDVAGHEPAPRYDQIQLAAAAQQEVDTDTLVAVVTKEHQAQDHALAADEVNRALAWVIQQAKAAEIEVETFAYHSQAVYRKQQLVGWRVVQSARLETRDPKRLGPLLGELQGRVTLQSLHNTLSDERRAEAEEALIADALAAFQRRAGLIAERLGRPGYRIVQISVTSAGSEPRPLAMRTAAMEASAVAPPAIEPGRRRVEVRAVGTIELDAAR